MIAINKIRVTLGLAAALALLSSGALEARTRKGDKILKQAQQAEARKEYEKALDLYTQALSEDPSDAAYQLGAHRVRFQVGEAHVHAGVKLRQAGQLDEALAEFQKAFSTDPSSAIALQEMRRTTEAIESQRKGGAPPGQAGLTSAERARKDIETKIESLLPVPELRPITNQISTLKMNNQPPKVLYETVGKLAGINVIFDPMYQATTKNVNLDLTNTTLEEALNYIGLLTKTFWKPISSNAIFVTDDNVTKRRDYEDEVVRVFYLQNVTTVQEFQEIVTAVRSVTDIRRMFTYNAQNAVMARGTVDQINLAEKLFHDLDKPKSEVVVDIIVLEANTSRMRDIAAGLTSGGTTGLVLPIGFTPRNPILANPTPTPSPTPTPTPTGGGTSGGNAISLGQIGRIGFNDFSISLPGALLQATLTDSQTRILQSPQIRASDGQKVSLKIGEKVPYATGSFQPGIGTVGVSPLVSTQFQFAETGVNVELTPHVHGNDELSMHILVDLSNVSRNVDLGGLQQPVIAQRKNEADIRLRDGEVTILGGLINNQDTASYSGIPGLVNVPVLGKFVFGSNAKTRDRGNLLIALIPHIVRTPNLNGLDLRGVAAGTDQTVKLNYAPKKDDAALAPAAPAAGAQSPAPVPAPAATTPAGPPGAPRLSFSPVAVDAQLSAPVQIALQMDNAADLFSAPFRIKWDPKLLRLNQVTPGLLFTQDQKVNPPTIDIRNDAGEASIQISRMAGAGGVSGSGVVAQLTFMAVGKGSGTIAVTEANLTNSQQQPIASALPSLPATIR